MSHQPLAPTTVGPAPSLRHVPLVAFLVTAVAATLVAYRLLPPEPELVRWNWAFGRAAARPFPDWQPVLLAMVGLVTIAAPLLLGPMTPGRQQVLLTLSFLTAVSFHLLAPLTEGRGRLPLQDRLWRGGHAEFLAISLGDPIARDWSALGARYDQIAAERNWRFPLSKPPGCLMVYRALVALADGGVGKAFDRLLHSEPPPAAERAALKRRITAVSLVLFPFFTALTVLPLFALLRACLEPRAALLGCVLFGLTPAAALVSMHLDNALYPIVGVTALWLVVEGERRTWTLAVAGGVLLSLGVFVSFSLLPFVPLLGMLPVAWALGHVPAGVSLRRRLHLLAPAFTVGLAAVAAAAAPHALLVLALDYDLARRLRAAVEFHHNWWTGAGLPWRAGNLIQIGVWIGPPLAVAVLFEGAGSLWRLLQGASGPSARRAGFALATVAALLLVACTGTSKSEVMRLWEMFVPLLAAVAAAHVAELGPRARRLVFPSLMVVQVAFTLALHAVRAP